MDQMILDTYRALNRRHANLSYTMDQLETFVRTYHPVAPSAEALAHLFAESLKRPPLSVSFVFVATGFDGGEVQHHYDALLMDRGHLVCCASGPTREEAERNVRAAWERELADSYLDVAD